jgi:lipoprotein-releasing system permease protein
MYKLHLILKYLLKRRIAWVSLVAVMLCTTMVVVVRSVMGGWLEMFRESFHGLTGDIVIEGNTLSGFPYYEEIVNRVEQLPEVEAAVPTIYTFGLINIANLKSDGVQVIGYPIEKISRVHNFDESLHHQHKALLAEADAPGTPPARAELLRRTAQLPPTFDLRTYARVPLDALPAGVDLGPDAERFRYDPERRWLIYRGTMSVEERDRLLAASQDPAFTEAVRLLHERTNDTVIDYEGLPVNARGDVTRWPGMIAGTGVLNIKKNKEGETINRHDGLYQMPVKLTVMGMQPGSISVDMGEKAERNFWIVDDSRTGVWQFDSNTVYVPFDVLQAALGMERKDEGVRDKVTGQPVVEPARATDIHVKVKDGVDLQAAKGKIAVIVEDVFNSHRDTVDFYGADPTVETWEEDKATFINAIENETVLVTFLFGIISIVAIFLIFCIFYMIVVEKTKDIGIIKSVGATAGGVAGIFLGYGMAIGLVGGALGLLSSYLIVSNINLLHQKLGDLMGIQIWNPEVYLFDSIPNTMNPRDVAVITAAMIVASVVGALIPAIIAASKKPVDALRWE